MCNDKEVWKDIPGYEGVYRISNFGRIFSVHKNDFKDTLISKRGYRTVQLWNNGKRKTATLHRLLGDLFIPKITGKTYINHKNGDKTDNRLENLEWCSHGDNVRHAFKTGLNHSGVKHPQARFKLQQVRDIRRLFHEEDRSINSLSKEYNCCRQAIRNIVRFKSYKNAI